MKYTSQTGTIILGSEQERSTAPQTRTDSALGFNIVGQENLNIKATEMSGKEELSREEEDRFYRKAFETGLI